MMTKKQDHVPNVMVVYIGMAMSGYVPTVITRKKTKNKYNISEDYFLTPQLSVYRAVTHQQATARFGYFDERFDGAAFGNTNLKREFSPLQESPHSTGQRISRATGV